MAFNIATRIFQPHPPFQRRAMLNCVCLIVVVGLLPTKDDKNQLGTLDRGDKKVIHNVPSCRCTMYTAVGCGEVY